MNTGKPLQGRPVVVGEVLFDCFPDGEVLGGAPFNVAWHLQGYGCAPLLISRIGDDSRGRQVQEAMQTWDMDTEGLQLDPTKPTGAVDIRFEDKHHSFDILADQAYDHLDADLGRGALEGIEPALAYHGTLIIRTQAAKRAVDALLSRVGIKTFVDVNLRDPWWRKEDLPPMLERASWVKVNDEELTIVSEIAQVGARGMEARARALRSRYDLDLLIVTLGAKGAVTFDSADEVLYVEPDGETEVIDTVGAGDAFSSVVLLGLLEGWPVPRMMRRAQDFAGRICAQRGATSRNSALYESVRS